MPVGAPLLLSRDLGSGAHSAVIAIGIKLPGAATGSPQRRPLRPETLANRDVLPMLILTTASGA